MRSADKTGTIYKFKNMRKKKEYYNIFAKIAQDHNNYISIWMKNFGLKTVKVKNQRILALRDNLEESEKVRFNRDLATEYIITNLFIVELLNKEEVKLCSDMIRIGSDDDKTLGIACLYNLIESKKEQLKMKLNE